jgi:hydroxypyruvate reductase
MQRPAGQLREDALKIWRAGVVAVGSARLVLEAVEIERNWLRLGEHIVDLRETERIAVVGGGKAAAGMAVALEQALGPSLLSEKAVAGWVKVPGDCLLETDAIQLHAARPAGLNEPTEDGVRGVQQMLRLVVGLGPQDVCVALISGGGSALMPAPVDGCSLADEIELTRALSEHGATIDQMNTVRRELSAVKGGKLAAACRARQMFSLIISDVLGDDLSLVASGPTVTRASTPDAAIEILQQFGLVDCPAAARAIDVLGRLKCTGAGTSTATPIANVSNILLANNATAVDAAGVEAERLGYSHAMIAANQSEGSVEDVAHGLVGMAKRMREAPGPDCLISGGEPTVRLAPAAARGKGGRNQQLCLAALAEQRDWQRLALIAGGTAGEDGPTDAAGACVDEVIAAEAARLGLDPQGYLARNDAYSFFERAGGLLKTGPTHTNVCDLRVITASR